jgi:hypothetical protein
MKVALDVQEWIAQFKQNMARNPTQAQRPGVT